MSHTLINTFDSCLPREIRILIFRHLVLLHIAEEASSSYFVKLSAQDNSPHSGHSGHSGCSGLAAGLRQLLCLMSVSKTWLSLVLDGQLWRMLDVTTFGHDVLPCHTLSRIMKSAGPFVNDINLQGLPMLCDKDFLEITDFSMCRSVKYPQTNFVSINLTGCRSLTSHSLTYVLSNSPCLQTLNLRALTAVSHEVCAAIAESCPQLNTLDIGFCTQIPPSSLHLFNSYNLHVLRSPGLSLNDYDVSKLARNLPELKVLDLRFSAHITDAAFEAFVSIDSTEEDEDISEQVTILGARLGKGGAEAGMWYKRRVTRLIHLALSGCFRLTHRTCMNLAYSVPRLEIFEFADIGPQVHDFGMSLFLAQVPLLRMIDLGGDTRLTDRTLTALTPDDIAFTKKYKNPTIGSNLECALLSRLNISSEALIKFIKKCSKLTILHVDGTSVSEAVVNEFVQISRLRSLHGAEISVIDCEGVSSDVLSKVGLMIRPRRGITSHPSSWKPSFSNNKSLCTVQSFFSEVLTDHNTTTNWNTVNRLKYHQRNVQIPIRNKRQRISIDEYDYTKVVLHSSPTWSLVDLADKDRKKNDNKKSHGSLLNFTRGAEMIVATLLGSRHSTAMDTTLREQALTPQQQVNLVTRHTTVANNNTFITANNVAVVPQLTPANSVHSLPHQQHDSCLIS